MKLSPFIISGWLLGDVIMGQQQEIPIFRRLGNHYYENNRFGASIASVVNVPASIPANQHDTYIRTSTIFRQQPWALPLAASSAVAMLLMAGFEIFVLLKVMLQTFCFSSTRSFFCIHY